jgi:serine phosphatase RsbU (regulator of sigma subunit)/PAS domain-containing protein
LAELRGADAAGTETVLGKDPVPDRFRTALDAMLDSVAIDVAVRDDQGRLVDLEIAYLNPVAHDLLGRGSDELVGRRLLEAYPSMAGTDLYEAYRSVVETGEPVALDAHPFHTVVEGQDVTAWYHVRATRLGDGVLIVTRDVTAERQASQAIQDALRKLEAAQALAHIGIWSYDVATEVYSWSDELFRIFALDPDISTEDHTRAYRDAVAPEDRSALAQLIRKAAIDGQSFFTDHTLHLPSGETAHTVVHGDVVRDEDGVIVQVWGTMQDVTESTRTEYALEATTSELERELATVDALQRAILPELPRLDTLEIAACYVPAGTRSRVGGDWYDVFVLDDDRVGLVVGDVAGHGLPSAALMAQLRNGLRAYAVSGLGPAATLSALNGFLRTVDRSGYATCLYGIYETASGRLCWSHAGHLPPLVVNEQQGSFLEGGAGTPLGAVRDAAYEEREVLLAPGSCLVVYTDGLIERRGEVIDRGFDRLVDVVAELVIERFEDFCDELSALALEGGAPADDVCVLALRCHQSA